MFSAANGRNRHRLSGKPVMFDPADTEWGVLGSSGRPLGRWAKRRPTKRIILVFVGVLVACVYGVRWWKDYSAKAEVQRKEREFEERPKPPLFEKWHQAELALPQHHVADPFAGGKKYLWVENHVHGLGWGNHFQDLLFNAQLAYGAGRAFVFDNYTWNREGPIYSEFNGRLIPSQIPLSALITSPINGGPFLENDDKLRAIQRKYWHQICPEPMTVWTQDVKRIIGDDNASGLTIYNAWLEHLSKIDEPCLQIDGGVERIFDLYLYGQKDRLLDFWPTLRDSPLTRLFGYSPFIHHAFELNRDLFSSVPLREPYYPCSAPPATYVSAMPAYNTPQRCNDPYAPVPGLLAIHLRRGDFEAHCQHLAKWSSEWFGFNSFPSFPDQWVKLEGAGWGENTEENTAIYMKRCYPNIEQIVAKIEEVRKSSAARGIKDLYIMTNGKSDWVEDLKTAIRATGGWDKIASSRDFTLTAEQKEVAQAIDMMIGEKAQVMIGNGWSSMTANIVMMRMVRGLPPDSNRFL